MNKIRERTKEHFPTVLLTLLSIVQALALELLWSHVTEATYLFEITATAATGWLQVFTTLLGIVLVWIVYSGNAMRFSWVPTTMDSVMPFIIGIIEFTLVEVLGPASYGLWFLVLAIIVGFMNWIAHDSMRKARYDKDNEIFFRNRTPATLRNFRPQIISTAVMTLTAIGLMITGNPLLPSTIALIGAAGLLSWQFVQIAVFWRVSMVQSDDD